MRDLIDVVAALFESNHLLENANGANFRLAPGLDPKNYQIGNTMSNARTWLARVYAANNGGEVGSMDHVGYIWISLHDDTIIPVARSDEHHLGRDMIHDLIKDGVLNIDPQSYFPIYVVGGGNYIYSEDEIARWLIVAKKYLSYGGPDSVLTGSYQMSGTMATLSQFIAAKGKVKIKPGTLAPLGKQFFDLHKALSNVFVKALQTEKTGPAFLAAGKTISYYEQLPLFMLPVQADMVSLKKNVATARRSNDLNDLQNLFFGFDSPKQKIHVDLKKARDDLAAGRTPLWGDKDKAFWGDIDLAVDMLSDL